MNFNTSYFCVVIAVSSCMGLFDIKFPVAPAQKMDPVTLICRVISVDNYVGVYGLHKTNAELFKLLVVCNL